MKKSLFISPVICLFLMLLSACTGNSNNEIGNGQKNNLLTLRRTVFSLSTVINITVYNVSSKDSVKVQSYLDGSEAVFSYFNREMNPAVDTSALSRLNRVSPGVFHKIPDQLKDVLDLAVKVSAETDSTFDAAIYPLVEAWGFLNDEQPSIPDSTILTQLIQETGMSNVVFRHDSLKFLSRKVKLGLGGIAKGAAVDSVAHYFEDNGLLDYIIEAGGDLLTGPAQSKVIGIRHPRRADMLLDTLRVAHMAVATSGDYERFFVEDGRRYCHIINPRSGSSDSDLISVTVIAERSALSDAYATAVFVMGRERGMSFLQDKGLSGIVVYLDDASGDVRREYVNITGKYKK